MRVRSLLLAACMVVVPMLAMFSHHVPREVAAAARTMLWKPVVEWAGRWRSGEPAGAPESPRVADAAPATAAEGMPAAVPEPPPAAAAPPRIASSPAVAPPPVFDRPAAGAGRRGLEDRLLQLGATAIDCQPAQAGGAFLASCRVPVDSAGQLERLFQATGQDVEAALERLLSDVDAWKQRTAFRPPQGSGL